MTKFSLFTQTRAILCNSVPFVRCGSLVVGVSRAVGVKSSRCARWVLSAQFSALSDLSIAVHFPLNDRSGQLGKVFRICSRYLTITPISPIRSSYSAPFYRTEWVISHCHFSTHHSARHSFLEIRAGGELLLRLPLWPLSDWQISENIQIKEFCFQFPHDDASDFCIFE